MEFVTGYAGTDHISAADMASLYRGLLIADDVVLDTGQKLGCTMLDANTAEIGTGDCMLQAHHARVDIAEQLTIQSGSNGFNRNDLIVARYTLGTGNVQAVYLAVIEGTAVAGEASDPDYETGVIDDGAVLVEFPLWRIPLTGITVGEPERIMPTVDTLQDQITDGDAALQSQITALGESVSQMFTKIDLSASATTPSGNTWFYTGLSVSIPNGKCYVLRAYTGYSSGAPLGLAFTISSSTSPAARNYEVEAASTSDNTARISICGLKADNNTYYLWAKRSAGTSNYYTIQGCYW